MDIIRCAIFKIAFRLYSLLLFITRFPSRFLFYFIFKTHVTIREKSLHAADVGDPNSTSCTIYMICLFLYISYTLEISIYISSTSLTRIFLFIFLHRVSRLAYFFFLIILNRFPLRFHLLFLRHSLKDLLIYYISDIRIHLSMIHDFFYIGIPNFCN